MELISDITEVIQETSWPVLLFYITYPILFFIVAVLLIGKGIPAICKWMLGK